MTKLEKAERLALHYAEQIAELENQNKLLGERCNQLLKDKGNLTDELAKWKDEWQEQVQKTNDEGWERLKLTGRVKELEQQIEKMKNCFNCKKRSGTPCYKKCEWEWNKGVRN